MRDEEAGDTVSGWNLRRVSAHELQLRFHAFLPCPMFDKASKGIAYNGFDNLAQRQDRTSWTK